MFRWYYIVDKSGRAELQINSFFHNMIKVHVNTVTFFVMLGYH